MYPVPLVDEESARRGEELGVGFALRGAGAEVRTVGVVLVLVSHVSRGSGCFWRF